MVYEGGEDSFLLIEKAKNIKNKVCLDLGAGNLLISEELIKNNNKVVASDIDYGIFKQKKFVELKKEKNFYYVNANLLKCFKRKFDYILFNPPYLPFDEKEGFNFDTTGGKEGWETSLKFLEQLNNALKIEGIVYLIVSNYTKNKIDNFLNKSLFEYEIKKHLSFLPFEEIWLYEIKYNHLIRNLNESAKKLLTKLRFKYYNKGKRSIILKVEKEEFELIKICEEKTIRKEYYYLKTIEKKCKKLFKNFENFRFIPKFKFDKGLLFIEEIKGKSYKELKKEFLKNKNEKTLKKIKLLFRKGIIICFLLDLFKINKFEMNHPEKHIIITNKGKVVFIDFERSTFSKKTKNLTQFSFFVFKELEQFGLIEKEKNIELKKLLQKYKKEKSWKNVKRIIDFLIN